MSSMHASPSSRIVGGVESTPGEWQFMSAVMYRDTQVVVQQQSFLSLYVEGSIPKLFNGPLVSCGKAFSPCFAAKDSICLIERGETFFFEKVQNCEAGGGIGAIIYNNIPGIFGATLGDYQASIPAVSVSQDSGITLLSYLNENVSIDYYDTVPIDSFCGASYLGGKWVVTAAHCVNNLPAHSLVLNMGGHDLQTDQENIVGVTKIHVHPDYDEETIQNDIALLELSSEPHNLVPVEIADLELLNAAINESLTVTALGRGLQSVLPPGDDGFGLEGVAELYQLDVKLTSNTQCDAHLQDFFGGDSGLNITNDMVCAGDLQEGKGVCFGDSGGPLVLASATKNYLLGVASWVPGCAQQDLYDVYGNVPYFKTDIDNFIQGKTATFGGELIPVDNTNNSNDASNSFSETEEDGVITDNSESQRSESEKEKLSLKVSMDIWGILTVFFVIGFRYRQRK